MSGSLNHSASAQPNLTPILDMVFQLITFFMLVINFKSAQIDFNMDLPVVGTARPVDTKGQVSLVVLNINRKGQLTVYNRPIADKDVQGYIETEARASLIGAKRYKPDMQFGDELPATVVVRADQRTPFSRLNMVLKTCQDAGFRNFAFRAMNKAKGS